MAEHGRWDGVLPQVRLLAEWPDGENKPTQVWLSDLPEDTSITDLVRLTKIRWRIEHDYRYRTDLTESYQVAVTHLAPLGRLDRAECLTDVHA